MSSIGAITVLTAFGLPVLATGFGNDALGAQRTTFAAAWNSQQA
jgi:hypothetical protein